MSASSIVEQIKQLLSFQHYSNRKRRRPEEEPIEDPANRASSSDLPNFITKYRRVSNNFPKLLRTQFDDEMDYRKPFNTKQSRTMQRSINGGFSAEPSFLTNPPVPRNYGDIEFSDDEDDVALDPRAQQAAYHQNAQSSSYGMSRNYTSNLSNYGSAVNGNRSTKSKIPDLIRIPRSAVNQPTAAHLQNGHSSENFAEPCTSSSAGTVRRVTSPVPPLVALQPEKRKTLFSRFKSNFMSKQSSSESIVQQNFNLAQKKNYQQLLEKLVPGLYRHNAEQTTVKQNRSVFGNQNDQSSVSKSQQEIFKKPQPYVIDLSDDEDEEYEPSTSIEYRRSSYPTSRRNSLLSSTKLIDDSECRPTASKSPPKNQSNAVKKSSSTDSNDSVQIVNPVNTLLEGFENRPCFQPNYVDNLHKQYSLIKSKRGEDITQHEKTHNKIQRETKEREQKIAEQFGELQIQQKVVVLDEEEEEVIDEFPELSDEQLKVVNYALRGGHRDEVIITKFKLSIKRYDFASLVGTNWLNDEVMNFYMYMLGERGSLDNENARIKVHVKETFFVQRYLSNGYSGVRRWTKKTDIFAYDVIPVPVHVGSVHWCMAIIHLRNKTIKYYDSMGQANYPVLELLEQYLKEESLDKKQTPFDMSGWTKECVKDCPRQMNGSDCGVFSCMFAEFVCRDSPISFDQRHMQYFRHKMIYEIATGKLLLQ